MSFTSAWAYLDIRRPFELHSLLEKVALKPTADFVVLVRRLAEVAGQKVAIVCACSLF